MDTPALYKRHADVKQRVKDAARANVIDGEEFTRLSLTLEDLGIQIQRDLYKRKCLLTQHGMEWVFQDGRLFALERYNTGMGEWCDLTTQNIYHWLGY